jgi:endonuclease I
MHFCQCSQGCRAVVKTPGVLYARGHSPASHSEERNAKAQKEIQRLCDEGLIKRLYGEDNVSKRLEVRAKISKALTGHVKSAEHRRKLSEAKAGVPLTEEHRKHMSEGLKGHPVSEKHRQLMSKKMKAARKRKKWIGRSGPLTYPVWNKGLTKETDARVAAYGQKNVGHPIHSYGRYPYKGALMRSTWEVVYAKYLESHNLAWEYEKKVFYVGRGPWNGITYRPDFYIPEQDLYVEVKGAWLNGSQAKIKAFREKYPEIHLLVVTQAVFTEILRVDPRAA